MNRVNEFVVLIFVFVFLGSQAWAKVPAFKGKLVSSALIIDLESGRSKIVRKPTADGRVRNSLLSPDGQILAFRYELNPDSNNHSDGELRILDLKTYEETPLFRDKWGFDFEWSPDSKFLIYKRATVPFGVKIFQIRTFNQWDLDLSSPGFKGVGNLKWEKDGETITYGAGIAGTENQGGYYRIKLGEKESTFITLLPSYIMGEVLSPDDTMVAFTTFKDTDLFIYDFKTDSVRTLGRTRKSAHFPFWSPDGQWVGVELSNDIGQPWEVVAWNLPTGKKRALPTEGWENNQWWYPQTESPVDCEKIILNRLGPGKKLTEAEILK